MPQPSRPTPAAAAPATRALVAGEANVDLVLRGDVVPRFGQEEQLLEAADLVVGSSAAIAACGLATLGIPTHLVAVLGDDEFGRFMRGSLMQAGVEVDVVSTVVGTPTGVSVILSRPEDRSILTLPGTIPLLSASAVKSAVQRVRPKHVHFASFFLMPALAAELPGLLPWLRSRGITTSLDTNWDPSGRWEGLAPVLPSLDILFPNLEELRAVATAFGWKGSTDEDAARTIAAQGPRVVVKAGAHGGWSLSAGGPVHCAPAVALDVIDTTGAGDSFDAGYLAAMLHGVEDEAARVGWAAAAGSLSTRGLGGTSRQPNLDELLRSLP